VGEPLSDVLIVERFTSAELPTIRAAVRRLALDAGLSQTRAADLVLAVNELATNAILHAGGAGSLTVQHVPGGVAVEVRDQGPGLPAGYDKELPGPDIVGGRGLWLVRRLCQQVTFFSSTRGASVRLVMSRA
jgi:anti-sigma regulatory factor (Ser/Thr protein kinase)